MLSKNLNIQKYNLPNKIENCDFIQNYITNLQLKNQNVKQIDNP